MYSSEFERTFTDTVKPMENTYFIDLVDNLLSKKEELKGHAKKVNGGGGGNRTRVRKSSTRGSTCLVKNLNLIS